MLHIVLISRHYAIGGSGGARRPWHWVKGLRAAGHRVTLITPEGTPGADTLIVPHRRAPTLASALPADAPPAVRPESAFKTVARNWRYWPDPDIQWYADVRRIVKTQLDRADWLITTSPPESAHRYGRDMADHLGARWCAEFRDPWFEHSLRRYLRGPRRTIEKALAKRWMSGVNAAILVHPFMEETSRDFLPAGTPTAIISHFCDWDGIDDAAAKPMRTDLGGYDDDEVDSTGKDDLFDLVYAGGFSLSDYRRNLADPLARIEHASDRRVENGLGAIRLTICGRLSENEQASLSAAKVETHYLGAVPFKTAMAIQSQADALLIYGPNGVPTLPGKYADALALRKPIVFYGDDAVLKPAPHHDLVYRVGDLETLPSGQVMPAAPEIGSAAAVRQLLDLLDRAS